MKTSGPFSSKFIAYPNIQFVGSSDKSNVF